MQNLKVTICILALAAVSGCSSYEIDSLRPIKANTIQVVDFTSEQTNQGALIADAIRNELVKNGFTLAEKNADVKITGSVLSSSGSWATGAKKWVSSIIIQARDRNGDIVLTCNFDQNSVDVTWFGEKTESKIGSEIGKKLAKKLK